MNLVSITTIIAFAILLHLSDAAQNFRGGRTLGTLDEILDSVGDNLPTDELLGSIPGGLNLPDFGLPDPCAPLPGPCGCACDDVEDGVQMIYKRSLDAEDPNKIRCFPKEASPYLQFLYDCVNC